MTWGPKRLDLRQLLSVKSMMHRSPKGTAGLERRRVRGDNLEPRPPASRKVDVSKRMFCTDFIGLSCWQLRWGLVSSARKSLHGWLITNAKRKRDSAQPEKCLRLGNKAAIPWLFTGRRRFLGAKQGAIWKKSRL